MYMTIMLLKSHAACTEPLHPIKLNYELNRRAQKTVFKTNKTW